MKQAVSELEYLTTFNRSVSQTMARTMQDLSEAVFINMANLLAGIVTWTIYMLW